MFELKFLCAQVCSALSVEPEIIFTEAAASVASMITTLLVTKEKKNTRYSIYKSCKNEIVDFS